MDFNIDNFSVVFLQYQEIVAESLAMILTSTKRLDIAVFHELQLANTTTFAACQIRHRNPERLLQGPQIQSNRHR